MPRDREAEPGAGAGRDLDVSYVRKTASVTFDDAKATVAALIEATTKSGYPSRVQE